MDRILIATFVAAGVGVLSILLGMLKFNFLEKRVINKGLTYKGFKAKIEYSKYDGCYFGKICNITDLVTFESYRLSEVEIKFHNAVNDYLTYCKDIGKEPIKE